MACYCGKAECPERHGITLHPRCKAEEWQRDGRGLWAMRRCLHVLTDNGRHAGRHEFSPWHYNVSAPAKCCDELLAALKQVRDFYLNADSAWRFSEGFDIDTVCRAIAKAEGEPYPPFEGTDVLDGDEDRP